MESLVEYSITKIFDGYSPTIIVTILLQKKLINILTNII